MAIQIIIGLGNPGKEYEHTYHNVGHLFIDYFKHLPHSPLPSLLIHKTNCFMNESGTYVSDLLKRERQTPEELLIAHDDSDLALGDYKLSFGQGSAGHHGIEDIITNLGTKNFWRLRIGIRENKGEDRVQARELVLTSINKAEMDKLNAVFEAASAKILLLPTKNST